MSDSDKELQVDPAETSLSPTFTIQGPKEPEQGWIRCIAWLSDGRLVIGSDDGTLRIWNLTTGTQEGSSMKHQGSVQGVITTEDGRLISCAPGDKRLRVWNTDADELTDGPWSTEEYGVAWWMALSQNEELLASYHKKGIVIWEMAGTMRIRSFIDHDSIGGLRYFHSACFSPNSDKLAMCNDFTVIVLDAASGEIIFGPLDVTAGSSLLYGVVWSSEQSDRLFVACGDGRIYTLDSSTGKIIDELKQSHRDAVRCLSLSPDGKSLASGSMDETVILWNVGSRLPVGGPLNHGSPVRAIAFSRSGEFVACCGRRNISVWRVPWWDNHNRKTPDPLLDQSAVISPDVPSNIIRESDFDFHDVSASRRPRPLQGHSRANPSAPPRVQRSMLSWRFWNMIPRFVLDRSHPTRIYMGWAEPRTHVASRSTISNDPSSPSDSAPTPPLVIVEESVSGESSEESGNDSIAEPEVNDIGCCGLLSRRRPRATAGRERERENIPVEQSLPRNSPPEARNAGIPNHPPSRPAVQDILELSAVVQSSDTS